MTQCQKGRYGRPKFLETYRALALQKDQIIVALLEPLYFYKKTFFEAAERSVNDAANLRATVVRNDQSTKRNQMSLLWEKVSDIEYKVNISGKCSIFC